MEGQSLSIPLHYYSSYKLNYTLSAHGLQNVSKLSFSKLLKGITTDHGKKLHKTKHVTKKPMPRETINFSWTITTD